MKERRKFVRLKINYKVDYFELNENGDLLDKGESQTEDVSKGGVRLKLDKFIKEGSILDLKIYNTSYKKPIDCNARIIWMKKMTDNCFEYGLDFTRIGWTESDRLVENPN